MAPRLVRRTATAFAFVAVIVGSCSGDDGDDGVAAARELEADRAALSGPCQAGLAIGEDDVAEALGDGFVPPGTILGLGEVATVPLQGPTELVTVELVVDVIEEGEPGDIDALTPIENSALHEDTVPWYVHTTLTNRSDTALVGIDPAALLTLCAGEEAAIPFRAVARLESCPPSSVSEIDEDTSVTACGIFLLPPGERPSNVAYDVGDTPFALAPVRWDAG